MQLSIKTNFPSVKKSMDKLQADIRQRATVSAVNKTIDQGKTQMVRAITREFVVKADYVRARLNIKRARYSQGAFSIEATLAGGSDRGRSANIIAFVEKKVSLAEGRRRAKAGTRNELFVQIKRGAGKKGLGKAFIGNKGRTVFIRSGDGRLPIEPVQVIDVAQMFNTKRINKVVVDFMKAKFPEIFDREAKFFVDRFNRGQP